MCEPADPMFVFYISILSVKMMEKEEDVICQKTKLEEAVEKVINIY